MLLFHFDKDGNRRIADLSDMFQDVPLLLVGGGTSLGDSSIRETLSSINTGSYRGYVVMAMNNAAAHIRCNIWCGADPPQCYLPQILADPSIIKFAPLPHAELKMGTTQYFRLPNLFFFTPGVSTAPWSDFFSVQADVPYYHNTMFSSIALAYQLGFRDMYLVGCDFGFVDQPYAHLTSLTKKEKDWNRKLYTWQKEEIIGLKTLFTKHNVSITDTSPLKPLAGHYNHRSLIAVVQDLHRQYTEYAGNTSLVQLPHCSRFAGPDIGDIVASHTGQVSAEGTVPVI
jgi:hypothetical protein